MSLAAGACSIRRIACNVSGERHFHFEGVNFEARPLAKTYFGDVTVAWKNDQGFKPSQLFGLIGALVDQSINDGTIILSVADGQQATLAWYDQLVKHQDRLPLKQSLVPAFPDCAQEAPINR